MATNAEMLTIAKSLIEKSKSGEIEWAASEDSYEYETSSGRFAYYIKSRDEDDRAPFRLQVVLRKEVEGELPVLAEAATITGATGSTNVQLNAALRDLYDISKLTALGVGTSLADEVMKDLGAQP